jgi:cytochrome c
MWSLKTNVKFMAVLVAIWLFYLAKLTGDFLVPVYEPTDTMASGGTAVATKGSAAEEKEEKAPQPLPVLLASADAEKGAKVAKKCVSCHTFEAGGKNKIGPNLHNIVGANKRHVEGFNYSGAFQDLSGQWTYEELDAFLHKPKEFAKGTKMTFAGLKKAQDRADVILFLRQNTESPPPLPAAN